MHSTVGAVHCFSLQNSLKLQVTYDILKSLHLNISKAHIFLICYLTKLKFTIYGNSPENAQNKRK